MLLIVLNVVVALLMSMPQTDDPASLISQGTAAYQAKDYAKAVELYEAAIKAGARGPASPYNAACCCALMNRADEAFAWLDQAIAAGWRDVEHLKTDTDLYSLHGDARWERVLKRAEEEQARYAKSLKEPALREELLKRMAEDQRVRMMKNPDFKEWKKIDEGNCAFMKTVIEKYGWPGKSMVGDDGALAAFLMVQHADADHAFQKRCLELMTKAVEQKEAEPSHMAYLTDRVLVADGKPQRYGTQFRTMNGVTEPYPIEDAANVDVRRKDVGLGPLEEYAKQMRSLEKP